MDPPEHLGIQPGLQLVESPVVRRARDLPSHNTNRIFGERGIDDVVGLDQGDPVGHFDRHLVSPVFLPRHHPDQPFELVAQRRSRPPPPDPLHSLFQPAGSTGFST